MTFTIGQRWISNTESQLGLGIITQIQGRHVSVSFPAAQEERVYARDNAPLSRIIFKEGEEIITLKDHKVIVTSVIEHQGLIGYRGINEQGEEVELGELELDCFIKLNSPEQRLFSGLLDKLSAFKLRIATLDHASRLQQSKVSGLLGARTNHLPHQVYIANEVAQRYAPRVLLADEVGLGKTIEAGMILHYQRYTGRAERILIIVPATLIHQWLVEMIRRFNLHFTIIDQHRYDLNQDALPPEDEEAEEDDEATHLVRGNPFETQQLVLCSLEFLIESQEAQDQILATDWDLLVVDEAHHLAWSEHSISPEYALIQQLSSRSKGLLLLTATPEQVGIESHFARLQLLDPARFYDVALFKEEEKQYKTINDLVKELSLYPSHQLIDELNPDLKAKLSTYLGGQAATSIEEYIKHLLDRHGTGRVLFRNTRAAISGFPERRLHSYPMPCPLIYFALGTPGLQPESALPEDQWLKLDPRVAWLTQKLTELYPQKVLVICAKANTAIALEHHLKLKEGIRCTAFHEGLSIIDRDRSAAYFAEEDSGATALICSEIGSEGRNFQFAHHLVLFDLPLNPDLLEQRIGRLDRLGQLHPVEIHVPYLENTAQEVLFRWYHEGINLFHSSCSVGFSVLQQFNQQLLDLIGTNLTEKHDQLQLLIADTKEYTEQLNKAVHEGRDKLLEMNSCDNILANELITAIEQEENSLELEAYLAQVFQEYGVEHEYHSDHTEILSPSAHMKVSHFPGLKEDGTTVTYSRSKALLREDFEFLSWEHPMVQEAMDMILVSELGNAALASMSVKNITSGTLFLEAFYSLNCAAPKSLQLDRYVPITPLRFLVDGSGKNLTGVLTYPQLNSLTKPVASHLGHLIVKQIRAPLTPMLEQCQQLGEQQMKEVIDQAIVTMHQALGYEFNRLKALQKVNPTIRAEELEFIEHQIKDSEQFMRHATLKLQALRVVINQ